MEISILKKDGTNIEYIEGQLSNININAEKELVQVTYSTGEEAELPYSEISIITITL